MRARHRHFNPRFAGADLVLDSRYLTQTDNTAVSIWVDRSGNGYNATQANATNQPTFRTGQQGGNGGVDFDGNNDFMTGSHNPITVPRTVHSTFKTDQTTTPNNIYQTPARPAIAGGGWLARWGVFNGNWLISGDASATNQSVPSQSNGTNSIIGSWSSDSSRNVSFVRDGLTQTVSSNPPNAVSTPPQISGYRLGSVRNSNDAFISQFFDGPLFSIHVWGDEQIAAPLRKRCEHASAYSFKIACS